MRWHNSQDLGNGNVITHTSTYTKADGTSYLAANLALAHNPFYRIYTDDITLTDQAKALPDMRASGKVRDLRQAMSLATPQASILVQLVDAYSKGTYTQQQAGIDELIIAWANTSTMQTSAQTAKANGFRHSARVAAGNKMRNPVANSPILLDSCFRRNDKGMRNDGEGWRTVRNDERAKCGHDLISRRANNDSWIKTAA